MVEYIIIRQGILFFAVEKGKSESINGKFYDNITDAYMDTCSFLRSLGTDFCLSVPMELYE